MSSSEEVGKLMNSEDAAILERVPSNERSAFSYAKKNQSRSDLANKVAVIANAVDACITFCIFCMATAVLKQRLDSDPNYTCGGTSTLALAHNVLVVIMYLLISIVGSVSIFALRREKLGEGKKLAEGRAPGSKCGAVTFILGLINPGGLILAITGAVLLSKDCYGIGSTQSLMTGTVVLLWLELVSSQIVTISTGIYRIPGIMLLAGAVQNYFK